MIKIVVTAPRGKMDKLIIKVASLSDDIKISGAIGPAGSEYIGSDAGIAAGLGYEIGAAVYGDIEEVIELCDVVVDFSMVENSMEILKACIAHKKPLICGTTGFQPEQEQAFVAAGKKIPVLKAANTSYVVNVMQKLLEIGAAALGEKCKIEIIDMHDEKKRDAPSGTAKELAAAMTTASGKSMTDIDFHSVRAGDISSTHTVIFGCMGERMEITHRAYNWECYARGACDAVRFLVDKPEGLYTMEDVIKL